MPTYTTLVAKRITSIFFLSKTVVSQMGVDTNQIHCYNDMTSIECQAPGSEWFGQDGSYLQISPKYQDNQDGTITDLNTGLIWEQSFSEKMLFRDADAYATAASTAGYSDWRLPTVTELYSLILFNGITATDLVLEAGAEEPYIDTDYFLFQYGPGNNDVVGERTIDVPFMTNTLYVSTTMNGDETMFGVNFADGRIKGYPTQSQKYNVRLVRGTSEYDSHDFTLNNVSGSTVYDRVWGLTWMQADDGSTYDWQGALNYCQRLELDGFSDWRVPNAKELQGIVDYTRSPETTNSPALDPIFEATAFINEGGDRDWGYYWTSTTHLDLLSGEWAVYVAFGRALGYFNNQYLDVHGAGAQRSDPKSGEVPDPEDAFSPQGDIIRINNFVRCVRGGQHLEIITSTEVDERVTAENESPEEPPEIEPPSTVHPPIEVVTRSPTPLVSTELEDDEKSTTDGTTDDTILNDDDSSSNGDITIIIIILVVCGVAFTCSVLCTCCRGSSVNNKYSKTLNENSAAHDSIDGPQKESTV